jgi:hypothetical protein
MSAKVSIPGSRPARWLSFLCHALGGALTGALLAGGYGALVAVVRVVSTGRWGRSPAFALGALLAGAVVGLLVGIAVGLSFPRQPRSRDAGARIPWLPARGQAANAGRFRRQA